MNITKKCRIQNFIESIDFTSGAKRLALYINNNVKDGIYKDYKTNESNIVRELFDGNFRDYYVAYQELYLYDIVRCDGDNLFLLLYNKTHFFTIKYCLNNDKKRKYVKQIGGQRKIINFHKPEKKFTPGKTAKEGAKVPRNLYPYLSCEPLKEKEKELLTLESFSIEEKRRNLSKEVRRVYFLLISISNSNGLVWDYNSHCAYTKIIDTFGDVVCETTFYYAIQKLSDVNLINIYTHKKRRCDVLELVGYKDGFGKGRNYVVLPYSVMLDDDLRKAQSKSLSLIIDILFRLNNCDNGNGHVDLEKTITFKLYKSEYDTQKDKEKYDRTLLKYNKRCNAEIGELAKILHKFFIIKPNAKSGSVGYYDFTLKEEYFISKEQANKLQCFIDPLKRYPKKAALINKLLWESKFKIDYKDKQSLVRILNRASKYAIQRVITTLVIDSKLRYQRGWNKIQDIGAYTHWLYKKYKEGDPVLFAQKTCDYYKDKLAEISKNALLTYYSDDQKLSFYKEDIDEYNGLYDDSNEQDHTA